MNIFVFIALVTAVCNPCLAGRTQSRDSLNREACYAQEKVYDKTTNKCYKLLTKGPCQKGSWFVLEKPKDSLNENQLKIEARCVREKCGDGEYYWSETKSCVKAKDKTKICKNPSTEELRYNVFGEVECSCTIEPPRARLHNNEDNPCFELYTKGPCHPGEVLGFVNSITDEPTCIPDPCYFESLHRKRIRTLAPGAVLASWKNNTCHELGTQGPCPEGLTFKVHSHHFIPSCVSFTNAIFDLEKQCFRDEMGNCQTEINVHAKQKRPACVTISTAIFVTNSANCIRDLNNVCQRKVTKKAAANKYLKELNGLLKRARREKSS